MTLCSIADEVLAARDLPRELGLRPGAAGRWDMGPGREGALESLGYAGPVLAVALVGPAERAPALALCGVGPDLHVHALGLGSEAWGSAGLQAAQALRSVLGGSGHVHGIRLRPPATGAGGGAGGAAEVLAAVFGPQHLAVVGVSAGPCAPEVRRATQPLRLADWPLDLAWLGADQPAASSQRLAVAFARNFVELWLLSATGGERQLRLPGPPGISFLYSAALHPLEAGHALCTGGCAALLCAGGTFEGHIALWHLPCCSARGASHGCAALDQRAEVLAGHRGAVFRVRLCRGAAVLLSASDDRTVRLWTSRGAALGPADTGAEAATAGSTGWCCQAVLRGHGSRVWDAVLAPLGGGSLGVASACEDSVVRLFSLDGLCLRELQGHQTRGVRCLEVHAEGLDGQEHGGQSWLLSGGEDGGVKLWPLVAGDLATSDRTVRRLWTVPDAADWIREVALPSHSEAIVATNFGRIYRLALWHEQALAEMIYAAEQACFTCLDVGPDAAQLWCGCADGKALVLSERESGAWEASCAQAFECCRVSAAFAGAAGYGAIADHSGRVGLWRCGLERSGLAAPELLAEPQLAPGQGGRGRLLCGMLLAGRLLPDAWPGGLAWVFGDEHGCIHAVGLGLPPRLADSHRGKVLCLCDAGAGGVLHAAATFFSSGSDGAIVQHRLEAGGGWQQLLTVRPGGGLRHLRHLAPLEAHSLREPAGPAHSAFLLGAFRSADFVLWDMDSGAELWRHRCGGGKRPSALHATQAAPGAGIAFTFAYSSGSKTLELHAASAACVSGAAPEAASCRTLAPAALRSPLHGREVHAVAWLAEPSGDTPGLLVTASEDGTMRLLRSGSARGGGPLGMVISQAVEQHPGAVRALAVTHVGAVAVVLSGGAKGALRAQLLEAGPRLRCVWAHALAAPCSGAAEERLAGASSGSASGGPPPAPPEERVMAVDCVPWGDAAMLAVAATSSGLLHGWRLELSGAAVAAVTAPEALTVRAADAAALSVRCFFAPMPGSLPGALVGTADGCLAVHGLGGLLPGGGGAAAPWLRERLHDAGVNDLAIRPGPEGEGELLVAAAGDDQQITLALLLFGLAPDGQVQASLLASRCLGGAHASSVRAVAWAPPWLLSLGLDRRLRLWSLSSGTEATAGTRCSPCPELQLAAAPHACRCTEPVALALAASSTDALGSSACWALALAGRGVELVVVRPRLRDAG